MLLQLVLEQLEAGSAGLLGCLDPGDCRALLGLQLMSRLLTEYRVALTLLHAGLGKMDDAITTLQALLRAIPDHLRAMLTLSTLLAHSGELHKAVGQAAAARELSGLALAAQQVRASTRA